MGKDTNHASPPHYHCLWVLPRKSWVNSRERARGGRSPLTLPAGVVQDLTCEYIESIEYNVGSIHSSIMTKQPGNSAVDLALLAPLSI